MTARAVPAEVIGRELVDIESGQVHRGMMMLALPAVTLEETIEKMLRVGILPHLGGQERDPLARRTGPARPIQRRAVPFVDRSAERGRCTGQESGPCGALRESRDELATSPVTRDQ